MDCTGAKCTLGVLAVVLPRCGGCLEASMSSAPALNRLLWENILLPDGPSLDMLGSNKLLLV